MNQAINNSIKDLNPLLNPKSIAIVGASEKFGAGSLVIENLMTLGFKGEIIPINPNYSTVFDLPCYPTLSDIPIDKKIDSIAIVLGYKWVIPVLEEASLRGIRGAWAFASGFAETGPEGEELQRRLRDLCEERGIMFCGPNCVGYVNLHSRFGTYSAPISPTLKKGKIGAVAQSGSVVLALANSNRDIGFSTLVSSGNEAVLDTVDYFEYFLKDNNTEVIIAFLEGIRRPEAFIRTCKRAAELNKPIIVVKVGRSEMAQKTVMTHTGALAGSDRVCDALFKDLGIIRVDDLDQLLETAEAFVHCKDRLPKGNSVGAITVSGGEIGLMGDLADNFSFTFPRLSQKAEKELRDRLPPFTAIGNPLDAWGSGDLVETYPACLDVMAREDNIDLLAVSQDAPPGMAQKQINQYIDVAKSAVKASDHGKPIVVFSHVSGGLDPTIKGILDKANIPFLQGTRESLTAINSLIEYGKFQRNIKTHEITQGVSPNNLDKIIDDLKGEKGILSYARSKEILLAYGIPVVEEFLTKNCEQGLEAANKIGYPIVLKGQSEQIPHKTETGIVSLNVGDDQSLRDSYDMILKNAKKNAPHANLESILVQEMVSNDAVEMILGIFKDPTFGPIVLLGLGGIFVELLKDSVIKIPPIGLNDAHAMISDLKGKNILNGFRGQEPADIDSLANTLVRIGQMAFDLKDHLISLDLNPLMVLPQGKGVRVVDIVMEAE